MWRAEGTGSTGALTVDPRSLGHVSEKSVQVHQGEAGWASEIHFTTALVGQPDVCGKAACWSQTWDTHSSNDSAYVHAGKGRCGGVPEQAALETTAAPISIASPQQALPHTQLTAMHTML